MKITYVRARIHTSTYIAFVQDSLCEYIRVRGYSQKYIYIYVAATHSDVPAWLLRRLPAANLQQAEPSRADNFHRYFISFFMYLPQQYPTYPPLRNPVLPLNSTPPTPYDPSLDSLSFLKFSLHVFLAPTLTSRGQKAYALGVRAVSIACVGDHLKATLLLVDASLSLLRNCSLP